ncbi:MAG TPA: type II toxin-antitoxin system prevent-host-death family antitoxin [Vineibacter sp.]|nr:type II toxin-antitoxin system prevent-host-death family antitoxin [Vineibacter sp.]
MQAPIHVAKANLSRLIEAALAGEEVIIAKGSKPVVKLVAVRQGAVKFGVLPNLAGTAPDFFEPLPEDEQQLWEGVP